MATNIFNFQVMCKYQAKISAYFFMITVTLLLYFWKLYLSPMINADGVTYIQAAAAYLKGGFSAAVAIDYQAKWPFYPILIAKLHCLTGFSILMAERILDAAFILLSACFFLYFVRLFSGHKQAGFWAVIVWITWHGYAQWWPAIIRDHGFLVCLLLSFFCYYHYVLKRGFFWACAWFVSLLLAELFRIEAMVYLALIPFSLFFLNDISFKERCFLWVKLNVLTLLALSVVCILFFFHFLTAKSLRFEYIWQEFSLMFSAITERFLQSDKVMRTGIFSRENDFSFYALLAAYGAVFFSYLVSQVSLAILLTLCFYKKAINKLNLFRQAYFVYLGVAAAIPLFFFAEHLFLNERYLLPLGLFLSLLAASILPHLIDFFIEKKKFVFMGALCLLLAINFLNNIFIINKSVPDSMIVGQWLKKHYPENTIFTNDRQILFYDSVPPDYENGGLHPMKWNGVGDVWLRQHNRWCHYDLLVISAPVGATQALRTLFAQFREDGIIGNTIKQYRRVSDGEDVLVAPILRNKCLLKVNNVEKNKRSL